MIISKAIKDEFVRLRNYDCWVGNFNSRKYNNPGIKNHPDWLIIKKNYAIIWVEVKIGKDKFTEGQKEFAQMVSWFEGMPHSKIYYRTVRNANEAKILAEMIMGKDL